MKSETKTIFRVKKAVNPFVQVDKYCIDDKSLSWKAKGLLCYMLSKYDNWKFYDTELVRHSADGITALRSAIGELKKAGYIVKRKIRNTKGQIIQHETIVYERPQPDHENLDLDNPFSGKPHTTNNDHTNIKSTKKEIKDKNTSDRSDGRSFSLFNILKENGCIESFNEESEGIDRFFQEYRDRLARDHPPVRDIQMDKILHAFRSFDDVLGAHRDLEDIMKEYFLRDDIDTDYNINHFASWIGGLADKVSMEY